MPGRDAVEKSLHNWNSHRGDVEGIILRPRRWETDTVPISGRGDTQSVINGQLVDKADIVIGIFYHRLGTLTPRAVSGTAEEIEWAKALTGRYHDLDGSAQRLRIDMLAPDTLTRRRERIAGIHRLSIDTIEL